MENSLCNFKKMDFLIASCVFLLLLTDVSKVVSGDMEFSEENDALQSCILDEDCNKTEFCSDFNKCVDCYDCPLYYKRFLEPETHRQCAISADDCGKCLPGYELERCSEKRYCDKCIPISFNPTEKNIDKPQQLSPNVHFYNSNRVNSSTVHDGGYGLLVGLIIGMGCFVALLTLGFVFWYKARKRSNSSVAKGPNVSTSGRDSPMPLLSEGSGPMALRPPPYAPLNVSMENTVEHLRTRDNQHGAVPFSSPSESYVTRQYPTAPPLSVEGRSDGSFRSEGSTAPSNWEPSNNLPPIQSSCPSSSREEVDSNECPEVHIEDEREERITNWVRQLTSSVSESSVFTTGNFRSEEIQPPDSFQYRSTSEMTTAALARSPSITLFNPPAAISRATIDSGFGPSRPQSGQFFRVNPPLALAPSSDDREFVLEFGVSVRRIRATRPESQ